MKKIIFVLLALITLKAKAQIDTTGANAHSWNCGNDSLMFHIINSDSSFMKRMARYDSSVVGKTSSSSYIIPVVFHIIIPTGSTYTVSYAQIQWQVAELNAAFKNQISLYTGSTVGPRSVNTNIEFRLACTPMPTSGTNTVTGNPNGWTSASEPGVVRYNVASTNTVVLNQGVTDPTTNSAMLHITHPSTTTYFPFADYLNIWCVPTIISPPGQTILGFGTFPSLYPTVSVLDGVVMRLDCIGSNYYPTGFSLFPNYDKGVTLAHEAGHYLGLYHTFQPCTGGTLLTGPISCYGTSSVTATSDGDEIFDTPPTKINFDLGSILNINSCHETYAPYGGVADEQDQLENYMCYSSDNKRNTFSLGQSNRMTAAFSTSTLYNRSNLVSSANLTATGVNSTPTSCSNYTNMLTGIFNYSFLSASCGNSATIQFNNPLSTGFSATSYTYNFGDGSSTYTTTTSPTIHSYTSTSTSSYTVSCTASNGTTTATYSTAISTSHNVSIVGSSGTTNTVSPYVSSVCRGKEETIFVQFSPGIPSTMITDGVNTYTVNNYMDLTKTVTIPYLITVTGTASYSLTPFCNNGVATFNVTDCCTSLITNGDFESTYTTTPTYGFYTDLLSQSTYTGTWGNYDVDFVNSTCYFGPSIAPFIQHATGKVMQVDGFSGPNTIVNIPNSCGTSTLTPRVWQQVITGLQPSTKYFYSFKILENYNPTGNACPLTFATNITGTVTPLSTQTLIPTYDYQGSPTIIDWVVYTCTFTTPSTGFTSANNFTITINQIKDFGNTFFDYMIDNITLQAMTPAIQAVGNATICPGNSTPLTLTTNCSANVSDYTYTWSPATGLTCTTCTATTASPTSTTVYTLVAVATSTVTVPQNVISTVTVTVNPTISISGNTAICVNGPSSTTLTVSSGASTYTWSPGATLNTTSGPTVVATPTVTTTYTVSGTMGACVGTQTVTVAVNTCTVCPTCTANVVGTVTANPTSGGSYCINNNITVSGNITFSTSEFKIAPNVTITVAPSSTLTIDDCHLYACSSMWQGIVVPSTSKLLIKNSSFIEDAIVAVSATTTTQNQMADITLGGSTFNKNLISLKVVATNTINPPSGNTYPILITGSAFTSRIISAPTFTGTANWPTISTVMTASTMPSPLQAPYLNSYSVTTCKNGTYPIHVVELDNVGVTTGAPSSPTYTYVLIGGDNFNLFDNHGYGIYANDANVTVTNSVFQNGHFQTHNSNYPGIGVGAYSTDNAVDNYRVEIVPQNTVTNTPPNYFYDMYTILDMYHYLQVNVNYTKCYSTATSYTTGTPPTHMVGEIGFNLYTNRYHSLVADHNNMYNIGRPIIFTADAADYYDGSGISNGRHGGQVYFTNNLIRPHVLGTTPTTQL
jgi:hypothetical protein